MDLLALLVEVQLITASGALAPGPLSLSAIHHGTRGGAWSGLRIALGHTIVEYPLYMLVGVGVASALGYGLLRGVISLAGAAALLYFTAAMVLQGGGGDGGALPESPVLTGIALSGLNPYFIIWWLTVGAKMALDILSVMGLVGLVAMYGAHVWMDYAWLAALSWLGSSARTLGPRATRAINLALAAIMLYFAVVFAAEGVSLLWPQAEH